MSRFAAKKVFSSRRAKPATSHPDFAVARVHAPQTPGSESFLRDFFTKKSLLAFRLYQFQFMIFSVRYVYSNACSMAFSRRLAPAAWPPSVDS